MNPITRRRVAVVALWVAGSFVAVVVAVAAIGLAGARVTGHTAMVRAVDPAEVLDPVSIEAPTVPSGADVSGSDTLAPTGSTDAGSSGSDAGGVPGSGNSPSEDRPPVSSTSTEPDSGAPPAGPTTTAVEPTPTTAPSGPSSTATTTAVGGTVKAQCINSSVSLVSAIPKNGFEVEADDRGPEQIEVQFSNDTHDSHVAATCRAGVITFTTKEYGGAP